MVLHRCTLPESRIRKVPLIHRSYEGVEATAELQPCISSWQQLLACRFWSTGLDRRKVCNGLGEPLERSAMGWCF